MKEKICQIMGISTASYYRWKESRKIIKMLEKYFTEEDLEEFIETGKIKRLEKDEKIKEKLDQYDHHILHNAAQKIKNIPNLFKGKKEFDLDLFINSIKKEKNRKIIIEEIEKNRKLYNGIIIKGTLKNLEKFSDLELELMHMNYSLFIKMIKK